MNVSSSMSSGVTSSVTGAANDGGCSMLLLGRYDRSALAMSRQSLSSVAWNCATPDLVLCALAPPSSSNPTSSPVTVLMTSGPVMNMCEVLSTMSVKSVMAGEYTAPPAQGPMISEICGMTPEASTFR